MVPDAISFSPSNLHSCSISCLEIDVAYLLCTGKTLRASSKCDIALKSKKKYYNCMELWSVYSNLNLPTKWWKEENVGNNWVGRNCKSCFECKACMDGQMDKHMCSSWIICVFTLTRRQGWRVSKQRT